MSTANHHYVQLVIEGGELHRKFVCTAPADAGCRRRPEDYEERGQETWSAEEATASGYGCWAAEWVEAVGIRDAIIGGADEVLASVPVTISFSDGVEIEPVREPDRLADAERARSDAAWALNIDRQGGA
ncbi:hypothetical protein ACUOFU_16940 [Microbacterium arabinogalactanolyticum]|uniref:hypothetical protein n=1 Tax=Microbacterium arabinogalactanolyticum TaxID=69365 RepID=UPI0040443CF3